MVVLSCFEYLLSAVTPHEPFFLKFILKIPRILIRLGRNVNILVPPNFKLLSIIKILLSFSFLVQFTGVLTRS